MSASDFNPNQLRASALEFLRTEDRPLTIGELALLTRQPPHRVLLAIEDARRAGQVHLNATGHWHRAGSFTPAFPDDGQQALPA